MDQSNQVTTGKIASFRTIDLVITAMFTGLICILSPFAIPTQPIPFTLSLFTIFLAGAVLAPRFAVTATIVYLLIGLVGVPVFSGFGSGPGKLFGYTGGYLMSYPIMAFIIAMSYQHVKKYKLVALIIGMLVALILCYILGTLWFSNVSGNSFGASLSLCVFPYIPFDLVKLAIAAPLGLLLRKTAFKNIQY